MKATRLISAASLLLFNANLFAATNDFASQMTYLGMSYDSGLERYDDSCMHGKETKVKQVS